MVASENVNRSSPKDVISLRSKKKEEEEETIS
jgi:hypothetical protein